jgi:hypothetical protein
MANVHAGVSDRKKKKERAFYSQACMLCAERNLALRDVPLILLSLSPALPDQPIGSAAERQYNAYNLPLNLKESSK